MRDSAILGFPGGSVGKNPSGMQETQVRSLGGKILWRRAWQPTQVFLPGESLWTEEPGGLSSIRLQRVEHNWATKHSGIIHHQRSLPWSLERNWFLKTVPCSDRHLLKFVAKKQLLSITCSGVVTDSRRPIVQLNWLCWPAIQHSPGKWGYRVLMKYNWPIV